MSKTRLLKRPKIGLALSSGGIRGVVHVGVIKTLTEAGIPLDCLSGSSAGAIVAASYACGTLDQFEKYLKKIKFTDIVDFLDPHFSTESLFKGKKVMLFLRWLTQDKRFSDLLIPIYIMASDVRTGKEVIFSQGKVAEAVMASMSVPPLFKPFKKNDQLLVDGGLLHLLPVEVLRKEARCDLVIASTIKIKKLLALERTGRLIKTYQALKGNFSQAKNLASRNETIQKLMSFYQLLKQYADVNQDGFLNKKETYNFVRAIQDCLDLGIAESAKEEKMADILIRTDVNGIGMVGLHQAGECLKKGERAAQRKVKKIKSVINSRHADRIIQN